MFAEEYCKEEGPGFDVFWMAAGSEPIVAKEID